MIRAILLDIEGTTSSIDFVKKTLFPYARRHLQAFVRAHAEDPGCRPHIDAILAQLPQGAGLEDVIARCLQWIDEDRKETALKALQGQIWARGYHSGSLVAHVYGDVAPILRRWRAEGIGLYIYSSGSAQAQQLFFSHSEAGDLTGLFSGYFDTTIGAKIESTSYARIAEAIGHPADETLFLSDVEAELDAATEVGMKTCLLRRPGSEAAPPSGRHTVVGDFYGIKGV